VLYGYLSHNIVLIIPIDTTMPIFWKHPIAIIFLMFYTLLCVNLVRLKLQLNELVKVEAAVKSSEIKTVGSHVTGNAGMLIMIFSVFFFVNGGYAIASKTKTKFYLWLLLIILIETFTAFNIG
jgi:hypothetical protein